MICSKGLLGDSNWGPAAARTLACVYRTPICLKSFCIFLMTRFLFPLFAAAILDDQSVCGRGERLALALARENINSLMQGSSQAKVEVDVYELQKDSQYDTTDTSKTSCAPPPTTPPPSHSGASPLQLSLCSLDICSED